jgi:6-phosphogluconolactonase (cycloisomerase 2 family)
LLSGASVVLQDNDSDNLPVSANGTIGFHTQLPNGGAFAVTVLTQPIGEKCTVANGSGTIASANVNVAVTCTPLSFSVGGSLSGLLSSNAVVLADSGGGTLTVATNGRFTFGPLVTSGSTYAVTVVTQPAGQDCTLANASGTVAGANITNVAITCAALPYTISANVVGILPNSTLVLENNGEDNLTVTGGGTYKFGTPVDSGTAYAVTIGTQPSGQTCAVSNGSGTVAAAAVTVTIICPWHILYVVNDGDGGSVPANVTAFAIDPTTGALASLPGGVTAAGPYPTSITADTSGKHLYVSGYHDSNQEPPFIDEFDEFAINSVTGALSPLPGSPLVLTNSGFGILLNPSGTLAYTGSSILAVDPSTGALTLTNATGSLSPGCVIAQTDQYAYCSASQIGPANPPEGVIDQYSINATTGVTTQIASFPAGAYPNSVVLTPNGAFAYAGQPQGFDNSLPNGIFAYSVNASSGALTQVAGSPFVTPQAPDKTVMAPNGSALYVLVSGALIGYSISPSTGALTQVSGVISTEGLESLSLVIDPSGKFIYFSGKQAGLIFAASINAANGALTPVPGSPFSTGNPTSQALAIAALLP